MASFTAAERAVVDKSFSNISSVVCRKAPSEKSTDLFQELSTEILERILLCLNPRELLDAVRDEHFYSVFLGSAKLQDVLGTRLGDRPLGVNRANVPSAQLLPSKTSTCQASKVTTSPHSRTASSTGSASHTRAPTAICWTRRSCTLTLQSSPTR